MEKEYNTLREEMLQLFREQSNLTYVTTISSSGILYILFNTKFSFGLATITWLLLLLGISWKIKGNYLRLFRIGSYIKIVHELKGNINLFLQVDQPGWMYRQREIGKKINKSWRIGSGPRLDGIFILLISFVAELIYLYHLFNTATSTIFYSEILLLTASLLILSLIIFSVYGIINSTSIMENFEKELLEELKPTKKFSK